MKKTIRKIMPVALFMLSPYLSSNSISAENNSLHLKINTLSNHSSCALISAEAGKIIVRNVIRK